MVLSSILIAVIVFAAVAVVYIALYARAYAKNSVGQGRLTKSRQWLLSDFSGALYRTFFKDRDPEVVLSKFGLDVKEHKTFCEISKTDPKIEQMVMMRVLGIACIIVGFIITVFSSSIYPAIIGIAAFALCFMVDRQSAKSRAVKAKTLVQNDVPRFLDLLQPELEAGVPIEVAIRLICDNADFYLAREIKGTFEKTSIGAADWPEALESLAAKYDVDELNSFVLGATTAYRKGVSITEAVARESKNIRETYLMHKKENASKAQNTILIPIVGLQIAPLLVFFLLPSIMSLMEGF